jgi:hypothetical protein
MKTTNRFSENLRWRELSEAANRAINGIKINSISVGTRAGRQMWIKRRRFGSELIASQANLFFRLAKGRVHVWIDPRKWQRWEVYCFQLLQGPEFRVFPEDSRTVCMDPLPGRHLCEHLKRATLTMAALRAAGRELRRAHLLWCPELDDCWSHGDPHLDNVIYDPVTDRARLIDFEVVHDQSLPAIVRQADDLLVFLQDLVCRIPGERWLPFAFSFIDAYNRPEVIAELTRLLFVPDGLPALWWKLRTENFERGELVRRVGALRSALLRRGEQPGVDASMRLRNAA